MSRSPARHPLGLVALAALGIALACLGAAAGESPAPAATPAAGGSPAAKARIPVIFDTDIGDDIDDTWALALILKSPELDLKLVVGDCGKNVYRAKLLARFLQGAGRSDVPVGLGLPLKTGDKGGRQDEWVKDYDLKSYPGKVLPDGVQAMIDMIMSSPEPITVIAVGPVQNLEAALAREPRIAQKARFVGMHGSLRKGYGNEDKPKAEYNVKLAPAACQKVFTAAWDMTITPLDTCGIVRLKGDKFAAVRDSKDAIAAMVIQNYRFWAVAGKVKNADVESSILFDTVAVYLAFSQDLCVMETLGVRVDDKGFTLIDPQAKKVNAAMAWKDLGAYEDLLVKRLTGPTPSK